MDGKVNEEFKSLYSAKEVMEFEEDLNSLTEKELLIKILKELRKNK